MPQRSLLVADDIENQTESGKRRSDAIRRVASSLAQRLKTGIDFLYVEDMKSYPPPRFDASRIRAWHSKHQEKLAAVVKEYPVSTRCMLASGSPADQILKALRAKTAPELIVLGTQGRKGLQRLLIGSVAEEVIRHAKRPVMVIGPRAQEGDQLPEGHKQLDLLVATDLGKNSRAAERYALSLAKRLGARVFLFHCLGDSYRAILDQSMVPGMVPVNFGDVLDRIRDDSITAIEQKVRLFRKDGIPCDYRIEENVVVSSCAVHQEAERGYDMVIMGTHGRNVLVEAFLGSTARETILNASVPVITVHSGTGKQ